MGKQDIEKELIKSVVPDPNRALQEGRPFVAGDGLLGDLAQSIHEAELKGEHYIAAELKKCEIKLGELKQVLNGMKHPFYQKLLNFISV